MADDERQLAVEGAQRVRVAACAMTAGLFYFGGQLWVAVVGGQEQTIGLLQGLAPAFHGMAAAKIDPRTVHEQFLVSHQYTLIASFLLSNIGTLLMVYRFATWRPPSSHARPRHRRSPCGSRPTGRPWWPCSCRPSRSR